MELTEQRIKDNKEQFIALMSSVDAENMDSLLAHLSVSGFFIAPCSTSHHLACWGGLCEHSLNVYRIMMNVCNSLWGIEETNNQRESIILTALLHDVGKMGDHAKANYTPNMVKSRKKNPETGDYDLIQSESRPYESNKELSYIDHAIRSVIIAERYISLTEEEEHAILYHNGKYTHIGYDLKETPLQMVLHFADMWSSRVTEVEPE